MTTVVSPASPTAMIYQDGETLDIITAGGTDASTATQITQYAKKTVLEVTPSNTAGSGVILPASSPIGSEVWLFFPSGVGTNGTHIYPSSGDTINNGTSWGLSAGPFMAKKLFSSNWEIFIVDQPQ
jgi:hypothetical protein